MNRKESQHLRVKQNHLKPSKANKISIKIVTSRDSKRQKKGKDQARWGPVGKKKQIKTETLINLQTLEENCVLSNAQWLPQLTITTNKQKG